MEKIYTIEFTTDEDYESLMKKIDSHVKKAYKDDKDESKHNDDFIKCVAKLTKVVFRLNDKDSENLDKWVNYILATSPSTKRSFVACYRRHLREVCGDVMSLAREYNSLHKND